VSADELEDILKDLPRHGQLVKDRGYRQVWRFEHGGLAYYLKFYPRHGFKHALRGNPALREFLRLQRLQKANVPAPRARNALVGFRINGQRGDAVIIEAIEPAVQLDQYLSGFRLRGEPVPNHRELVRQLIDLVHRLAKARLGHMDLHLGNILLKDGKLYLLDGYAVRLDGLKSSDLMLLGHSVSRFATKTDLHRGWLELASGGSMPRRNPVSARQWRKLVERCTQDNRYFGRLDIGEWHGHCFKSTKFPRRWATVSQLTINSDEWQQQWPELFRKLEAGELEPLKRSRSGDVWGAEITLGGRQIPIVIKRPFKRYWYRYFNEIGRGSRARRAWMKAWKMIARNVPTAWPLLLLEKRSLGYVTDNIIVFERINGPTLASVNLDELPRAQREMLFRRTGRILRQIDQLGFAHFDAKPSNWVVVADDKLGPRPMLIDIDGIRHRRWRALGIRRLLRGMRDHPQYTPADSLALCLGYAPYSRVGLPQSKDKNPAGM
jgi:tRNA A-37 threonylcarbamoyl transferase component Bud32